MHGHRKGGHRSQGPPKILYKFMKRTSSFLISTFLDMVSSLCDTLVGQKVHTRTCKSIATHTINYIFAKIVSSMSPSTSSTLWLENYDNAASTISQLKG